MTMPRHCIAEHACKCVYALLNPNRCSRQFQYWMFIETEEKEKYIHTHTNISRVRACADEEDMAKMDLHLVGVCEKWNVFATIDSNQINKVESKKMEMRKRKKRNESVAICSPQTTTHFHIVFLAAESSSLRTPTCHTINNIIFRFDLWLTENELLNFHDVFIVRRTSNTLTHNCGSGNKYVKLMSGKYSSHISPPAQVHILFSATKRFSWSRV